MKREIIPVILAKDLADFQKKLAIVKALRPKPKWIQIDVVDGKFTPWKTWPHNPLQLPLNLRRKELRKFNVEIDLMVVDPLKYAKAWIKVGAKRILFHIESTDRPRDIIAFVKSKEREVGLSLNPDYSPVTRLFPYLKEIDAVLLLGVRPGKSGQRFHHHILQKIRLLQKHAPALPIEVDGGVSLKSVGEILRAGATRLATASAIHSAQDPQKAYKQLLQLTSK